MEQKTPNAKPNMEEKKSGLQKELSPVGCESFLSSLFKVSYIVGCKTKTIIRQLAKQLGGIGRKALRAIARWAHGIGKRVGPFFKNVANFFRRKSEAFCAFRKDMAQIKKEAGFGAAVHAGLRRTFSKENRKTIFNYGAPVLGVCVLALVVSTVMRFNIALAVEVNGNVVGYVDSESTFETADQMLQERVVYEDGQSPIEVSAHFSLSIVEKEQMTNADLLCNNIIRQSGIDIVEAHGLYVDQKFIGAVTDRQQLTEMLDSILAANSTGVEGEEVSFAKNVEIKDGLYVESSIYTIEDVESTVTGNVQEKQEYSVVPGDSPLLIASKNGVKYADLLAMNPGIDEKLMPGQVLLIQKAQPFLGVQVVKTVSYDEEIAYETQEIQDSSKYKGTKTVTQQGENGLSHIEAKVTTVNGVETAREILSQETIKEPVKQVVAVGTKSTYGNISVVAVGNYIWPLSGGKGYVSQRYGNYGHTGMDIAAPYGTPILAVADGTVVKVTQAASQGKYVIVDHGNGWQTYYYHASSLIAKVGQKVSQGDVLALVGSTGNSTGNHLHIEFRYNGVTKNPANYIGTR